MATQIASFRIHGKKTGHSVSERLSRSGGRFALPITLIIRWRAAELFVKALGEVALAAEPDHVGDLGDRSRLVLQELRRPPESNRNG